MMKRIEHIHAIEILDSRGNPTLHTVISLEDGTRGFASVPSGASTGRHEAVELRDGDTKRYRGKGVLKAVGHVNKEIAAALKGRNVFDQYDLDTTMRLLDGTPNKRVLGANAILSVSMAAMHAAANAARMPLFEYIRYMYGGKAKYLLPTPLLNVFNGGAHADTNLDMQEFIVIPHAFKTFARKLQAGSEIFHALGDILREKGLDTDVGNEGGYAPDVGRTEDALSLLAAATKRAKYKLGKEVGFGIDIAASEFFDARTGKYVLATDRRKMTAKEMTALIGEWSKKYPMMSIEDPLEQDAWDDWVAFTKAHGKKLLVIGDDFYVTNPERIKKGIQMGATNAVLIKMNQIGTVSETMEAIAISRKAGQKIVISHRSGETTDTTIADLAVGVNAEYIKTGAPSRSERLAKYNRLLEIEDLLRG